MGGMAGNGSANGRRLGKEGVGGGGFRNGEQWSNFSASALPTIGLNTCNR